ncbi:MAG: hypothetical protein AAF441_05835 [Pseudomonadota bacterium]
MTANPKIEDLRRRVSALESPGQDAEKAYVSFGLSDVDPAAGGGLALRRVHEFMGWSAQALAIFMAGRIKGAILWCARMHSDHELYPAGFAALGCDARRLVVAECSSPTDALWAAEEGLRSGAAGAVVMEGERPLDLGSARRLQLAAEEGGALGLIVSAGNDALFPAAASRWHIAPEPGGRFRLELTRSRTGLTGAWSITLGPGAPAPRPSLHSAGRTEKSRGEGRDDGGLVVAGRV